MLERGRAAQAKIQQGNAYNQMLPSVDGDVFSGDIPELRNQANQMVDLMAQIRAAGIDPGDTSNPLVQDYQKAELAFQYQEGQSKQRQTRLKSTLSDYGKAVQDGKVNPGFIDREMATFLSGYDPLNPTQIPGYSKYARFDLEDYFRKAKAAIESGQTANSYTKGLTYGTETISARSPEALTIAADQAMADPLYQTAMTRGLNQLPVADLADVQARARANGIPSPQQFSRDQYMQRLGAQTVDRSTSRVSAAVEQGWARRKKQRTFGEGFLKQTAELFNPNTSEAKENASAYFRGSKLGSTDEIIEEIALNGDELTIYTKPPVEYNDDGSLIEPETIVRVIRKDRAFEEFMIPVLRGAYGSDADELIETVYESYKEEFKGDLKEFDPSLVDPSISKSAGTTPLGKKYSAGLPSANDSY